jgi:hypothetical protein
MNNPCEKHTNVKAECCPVCLIEQYEKLKKILTPDEKCNACHGRGYTVFWEHKSYPVPHDNEHHFLCSCVSYRALKYFGA